MADAMTTTASLDYDQTMWDRGMYFSLRPELHFDMFADVKQTDAAPDKGATLTFTIMTDMGAVTTAINESVDIDAVALADTQVSLTLAEYGNAVNSTWKVRATSFIELDRAIANAVGFNAGSSLDLIARAPMFAGTNVLYGGSAAARNQVTPAGTLSAALVRKAFAFLKAANVMTFGGYFSAVVHPHAALDLRAETGAAAWRDPHTYSQPEQIWNGEIGEFEGFRFISTSRAPILADAGSSTTLTDVYQSSFFGRQALAKAYSTWEGRGPLPIVIVGPVVDKLNRFRPVGWHWYGVYGRFREASLYRVETASSVGTNA